MNAAHSRNCYVASRYQCGDKTDYWGQLHFCLPPTSITCHEVGIRKTRCSVPVHLSIKKLQRDKFNKVESIHRHFLMVAVAPPTKGISGLPNPSLLSTAMSSSSSWCKEPRCWFFPCASGGSVAEIISWLFPGLLEAFDFDFRWQRLAEILKAAILTSARFYCW